MAKSSPKKRSQPAAAQPENVVPKFCNVVNFAKTKDNNYIATMIFADDQNDFSVVLGRIIVSEPHAKEIVKVLSDLIKKKK